MRSLLSLMPLNFLTLPIFKWWEKRLRDYLLRAPKRIQNAQPDERNRRFECFYYDMKGINTGVRAAVEIHEAISFFVSLLLIPVASYFYIFSVYPTIPQSLGGGKPTPAILIVNTEHLPTNASYIESMIPKKSTPDQISKVVETVKLEILYSTSDHYYVKLNSGPIIALDKDLIEGIIWNP